MLQIEHIYHFLFDNLFKDFIVAHLPNGVPTLKESLEWKDTTIYQKYKGPRDVLFFYDQEPIINGLTTSYLDFLTNNIDNDRKPILVTSEQSTLVNNISDTHLYYFFHGFAALDWFRGYYALNYTKSVVKKYTKDYISFNRIISGDRGCQFRSSVH
jgi:hypothetical protein